jgi:cellulose synthase/poly-beta-1,6-N-acetylglucosamine synthase-like glycosyltransferase
VDPLNSAAAFALMRTPSRPQDLRDSTGERSGAGTVVVDRPARWLAATRAPRRATGLTLIVPAFNEAGCIAETIASIRAQTLPPDEILVVDDGSTDGTGEVARACGGVRVLRPPRNTGSKAGAQTYALEHVRTPFAMAVDADTTLAPDAIERLLPALRDENVAAACGFVIPRRVRSVWERGRYVEYLFAFSFYKPIQDFYRTPLISSGCFSVYRTAALREHGGWSNRTMAEDMDLTWTLHEAGRGVRFVPEAVCYPIEPHDFRFLGKQLRRWSHGFLQNVRLHWRGLLHVPWLRTMVAVALWDATVAALAYLVLLPLFAVLVSPLFLLGYVIDWPAVAVPVLYTAAKRGELGRAIASLPGFFVLRFVNAAFVLRAVWDEWIRGRRLAVYEKGH